MATKGDTGVLVAEARVLVRELLTRGLGDIHTLRVVGEADSAESAACFAARFKPDVVLLGQDALNEPVEECVGRVLLASPTTAVVAMVDSEDDEKLVDALHAGAIGFFALSTPLDSVVEVIHAAAARETFLPVEFTRRILERVQPRRHTSPDRAPARDLTQRELEILRLLMQGLANAEMARQLGVSSNTVKNHLHNIYRKLGVTSRSQAFATATELGIAV
jgi:DNA-binding NarL/FixJ family response regulator